MQIPPLPTPAPFRDNIPDRNKDNRVMQQEQLRKPLLGHMRARKLRRAELAQLRSPACRLRPFWSPLSAAHWSLKFLYFQPSPASAGLRPSHRIGTIEMHSP